MNRHLTFAWLGLVVAATGCEQKPPPVVVAKPIEQPKDDGELKPPAKPVASDPAARKLLDEVLAAHTGGQPGKLAAFKECSFTRKGQQEFNGGRLTATWKRDFIWPDRYRIRLDTGDGSGVKLTQTFALRGADSWAQAGDDPNPKAKTPPENVPVIRSQFFEDALTLLFPFADAAAVVAPAGDDKDAVSGKELALLDVWPATGGHARLAIDKKTKLLYRLTYLGREAVPVEPLTKELTFLDYKELHGVKLAARMRVDTRAKSLGEWTELSVEMTKPDAKVFDGP
ncbi:MAG: hypothetical protein MUF18_00515 [Fimbriiglobus sp.]|jgi:hypothetical protein|nr:hypothetical protein [Fimbriiglobus sp.]